MSAAPGPLAWIDTADWRGVVPMRSPLDLTGSRLWGQVTPSMGGPAAATITSDDGSISWIADPVTKLTTALLVKIAKGARNGWVAADRTGQAAQVTVAVDVHRYVTGSPDDEWLGRTYALVLPASDSALVLAGGGISPILINKQPDGGILLPALQVGPQGPPNDAYTDQQVAAAVAQLLGSADTDHNTLGKLAALIAANAASLSAILGGANPALDTFIEAYNRFLADESASAAVQASLSSLQATFSAHAASTNNPHAVTKAQVGLGSVDNTADINKPVSTPQAAALAAIIQETVTALQATLQTTNALSEIAAAGTQTTARANIGAAATVHTHQTTDIVGLKSAIVAQALIFG